MRRSESPSSTSPPRKRQRLSSPTYDEQLADLSQEDIAAFDAIEAKLSQASQSPSKWSQSSQEARAQRTKEIAEALSERDNTQGIHAINGTSLSTAPRHELKLPDDPDNPFSSGFSLARSIVPAPPVAHFTSALHTSAALLQSNRSYERSPSPDAPPDEDFSSWFQPGPTLPSVAFQPAQFASAAAYATANTETPTVGFMKASHRGWITPSESALAKAREKMNDIWPDEEPGATTANIMTTSINEGENAFRTASVVSHPQSPNRPALRALENSLNAPNTPSPAGFSRPSVSATSEAKDTGRPKAFKSPMLRTNVPKHIASSTTRANSSPLNPNARQSAFSTITAAGTLRAADASSSSGSAVTAPGPSFTTPTRPLDATRRSKPGLKTTPAPFSTPFKPGMKPGQPGRFKLDETMKAKRPLQPVFATTDKHPDTTSNENLPRVKAGRAERSVVFDLTMPPNRMTLASSGLFPQQYTAEELESMGINEAELSQITPNLAAYYSFHTSASSLSSSAIGGNSQILGPSAALDRLLELGCTLATKPWVDNHWCLILWKLASMVFLDPKRENDPNSKRWCWAEVMRQMLYRYERELNGGSRPPLRLITTQDAPAAYPMVLCVSGITWSEAEISDDGTPIEPHPELEVTDGWYRLRAQVDAPLARAIRRGIIRVGIKMGVAGARLSSEKKDPMEILEAYNSTKLVLSGNSSHLVPWHKKLGFQIGPCISTLNSLTADGGTVASMNIVVVKTYPLAFFEFIEDADGRKQREGPRSQAEEASVHEKWMKRRDVEAAKLRSELEQSLNRYERYADRLEGRAGTRFQPEEDDYPPDNIDDLYDRLEDANEAGAILSRLNSVDSGWLARHIRDRVNKDRESAAEAIENDLKNACPPREVRSFRVLVVQDAYTRRRPANRTAQLTVWDVLNLSLYQGAAAGSFEIGHMYLVTNLIPTQQSAWMNCDPGSEVYLSTRRDSRWTRLKC